MAERAVVTAILLMIVLSICLYITESFIPIGKNMDFRDVCRSYLMKMEYCSGLGPEDLNALEERLEDLGFSGITVYAPESAKAGSEMILDVAAVYSHMSPVYIFRRIAREYEMRYSRTAIARRIMN
ncbi:MAG: hypothetical protein JXB33_01130 [Clostridia bacterium]|nr:hypothetical protein [Clostridia bacterium]